MVTPAGDMYKSMYWYKNTPIHIKHNIPYANLIAIEMSDYDVILGMDWLSTHHAVIDCRKKRVLFQTPEKEEFEFGVTSRSRLVPAISALKARRLLQSRCYGYLANIVKKSRKEKLEPKDVPVVREYISIFIEDLSRLPSDREVEFSINLILETAPISKGPYQSALVELKELKAQLEELIQKGFI